MSVTVGALVISLTAGGAVSNLSASEIAPLIMGAVIVGGLFQILFGVLRLGKYITLVPYSVVSGFMSGIESIYCYTIGATSRNHNKKRCFGRSHITIVIFPLRARSYYFSNDSSNSF